MNNLRIFVYTDGGNRNTGNKLGQHVKKEDLSAWAYLILYGNNKKIKDSGFEFGATNNAMELTAVYFALKKILSIKKFSNKPITLVSDSHYVIDPLEKKWIEHWIQTKKNRPNLKTWKALYPIYKKLDKNLSFRWVK